MDTLPALFVVDHDESSLAVIVSDLERRFGRDFSVRGSELIRGRDRRLARLAQAGQPVALVLVDDSASEILACVHELHPRSKRVLLVDRDYSATSPAVQAMALGRADYHLVRPWADNEIMFEAMSGYLSAWTRERKPNFETFRIVAREHDPRLPRVRDAPVAVQPAVRVLLQRQRGRTAVARRERDWRERSCRS